VTVLAEELDEGALAGGVEDEMGLAVGAGLGGEQGAEPGGQAEVVRAERYGFLWNSRTTDSLRPGRRGEFLARWCRACAACALRHGRVRGGP
jgi:hypothetical protein